MFSKDKADKKYKFKSLQAYSWSKAFGNVKKYRKLFEKMEINYLSAELAFYNKLFDEEDWTAKISLKAFTLDNDKKTVCHCTKEEDLKISREDNIVTYVYGWGNDTFGDYWTKGKYVWEATIDGELVGSAEFYIEDQGEVNEKENPYFEALTLRTYEAPQGDLDQDKRSYVKAFDVEQTRYIMGELRFLNKITNDWLCEMFFNIYDDTGQLIGSSDVFQMISPEEGVGECFTITAGWGGENPGTWIEDNYRMEVVFMDTVIGIIPFSIGKKYIPRVSDYEALLNQDVMGQFTPKVNAPAVPEKEDEDDPPQIYFDPKSEEEVVFDKEPAKAKITIDDKSLEEILKELDSLIGLGKIKHKVREYVDYLSFLQLRKEKGFEDEEEVVLHSVFTGNPGTGKTTVVKLLGRIYNALGLLSKGHVHAVESTDLVSGYVRQSGKDTKEIIEKARGGILFIDEAYMLFKAGATTDFGMEAIAALITEMSDGKGDIAIMMAGYPKEMEEMLKSNPGLKSRIRNYFHFDDYSPDELLEIAQFAAEKRKVEFSPAALEKARKIITDGYRLRDLSFGNARFVNSIVDEAKMNLGIRMVKEKKQHQITKKMLSLLEAEDIEDINEQQKKDKLVLKIDEDLLKSAMEELNSLTGLENIKQEVNDLVKLTRYYKEMNRDILNAFSMHSIFTGNPGTGKTTVARIMGKIFKSLGLLERGHLIEADGSDLIAGFLGQSALKTKELIEKAMGGILFVDEAYAITEGYHNEFGKKAVATLVKQMEDHRKEFGLIVAGYTQNMEEFLESNPGLKSRFERTFQFMDFSEKELFIVAMNMLKQKGLKPDARAEAHLQAYLTHLYTNRNKFFGNARSVRSIIEKAFRNQELRMASISKDKRTPELLRTLILEDVLEFQMGKEQFSGSGIGYKFGA